MSMEQQFNRLTAPPRSKAQQQASKDVIAKRLAAKKTPWPYYTTLVAACFIVLLLAGSYMSEPRPSTTAAGDAIESIYSVRNFGDEPLQQLNAFYHIDKLLVDHDYYAQFSAMLAALEKTNGQLPSNVNEARLDFLVTRHDGTEQYIRLYQTQNGYEGPMIVTAPATGHMLYIDNSDWGMMLAALTLQEASLATKGIRLLLSTVLIALVLQLTSQLPQRNRPKRSTANMIGLVFRFVAYYWLISGTSMYLVGTKNGLVLLLGIIPFVMMCLVRYSNTKDRGNLTDMLRYIVIAAIVIFVLKG